MLYLVALVAHSVAVPVDRVPVVVVPFGGDVRTNAIAGAVENALPQAAKERGLVAVRADSVRPVDEAMRACKDDGCRTAAARRLGARFAILGSVDKAGALTLRIVDTEVGDVSGTQRVDGDRPAQLASVPQAVDALVDQVAPKATHAKVSAIAAARKARARGDLDDADAAFATAINNGGPKDVVNLWLERCRLYDAADRSKEAQAWDAMAAAVGPGSAGYTRLDDGDRARVQGAIRESLSARADYETRALRPAAAAEAHLKIATLFPAEASKHAFLAAELFAQAGDVDRSRALLERVAADNGADDDARLHALARLHAHGR